MERYFFRIADFDICISFADTTANNMQLLPSFAAFRIDESELSGDLLLTLTVDDNLKPRKDKNLVRKFDTGNGDTLVYQLSDGGYQFIIRDVMNRDCGLLICNKDFSQCQCALNGDWTMRSFGLNDSLMLIFAFAGSFHGAMLIHASCAMLDGWAYPFTAKSGTGKSTHTSLWLKHIEGAQLLNDDNPIIRVFKDRKPLIYGSPWSGKTPCYRNRSAKLAAVTQVERSQENSVVRQPVVSAFATMLPACSSMKWDSTIYNNLCDSITRMLETTPVCTLYCRPDEEAARVSHKALSAFAKE